MIGLNGTYREEMRVLFRIRALNLVAHLNHANNLACQVCHGSTRDGLDARPWRPVNIGIEPCVMVGPAANAVRNKINAFAVCTRLTDYSAPPCFPERKYPQALRLGKPYPAHRGL